MRDVLRSSALLLALALLLGATGSSQAVAAEGYKVIVHPSNPATSLSRQQIGSYFLKKTSSWPSGTSVVPVDLDKGSATRSAFSRDVLHKSVAEVSAYWQQQIFSGRAVPPAEVANDAAVVAFVASHEGAIGYVSESADVGNATVVKVVE